MRTNGSKLWRFAYRFEGRQKQIALGAYPEVTLAEARERREASRKLLAAAKDPSLERRLEKIARAAGGNTFPRGCRGFLDKQRREERSEATLKKNRWLLEPAYAAFGDRPVGEVTAPELLHALRKFEQRGRYESARRFAGRRRHDLPLCDRNGASHARYCDRSSRGARDPQGQPSRRHHRPNRAWRTAAGDRRL
ncbi:MAG: integrase arm-type DNA-binding domain-containing protein [Alphaproteobacteria bacterium]|nr:integrase arm-type DNA-binding domain-containing protein [Alphaproteobacteria bacterium]